MIDNQNDLKQLYEAYFDVLCRRAYAILRDRDRSRDCVQSMFLKLWENRARLRSDVNMEQYLSRSVRNMAIDEYRKNKTRTIHTDSKMRAVDLWEEQHHSLSEFKIDLRSRLLLEINAFKPKMKEIFILHYKSGLTQLEICKYMDIPKRTVEDNLSRAYKILKESLGSDQNFMTEFVDK